MNGGKNTEKGTISCSHLCFRSPERGRIDFPVGTWASGPQNNSKDIIGPTS